MFTPSVIVQCSYYTALDTKHEKCLQTHINV